MPEISQCKFCGSENAEERSSYTYDFVECLNCGARGPISCKSGHDDAVAAWNSSINDPRIAELQAENMRLKAGIAELETVTALQKKGGL